MIIAEILDKSQHIRRALRLVNINLSPIQTELILNVAKHVEKEQGNTTLKDLATMQENVSKLFEHGVDNKINR